VGRRIPAFLGAKRANSAMATQGEKYRRLCEFFKGSFRPEELEIFLKTNDFEVGGSVPSGTAGTKYFLDIVEALDHRGLIDDEFFDRLARERPRKLDRIQELARLWRDETGTDSTRRKWFFPRERVFLSPDAPKAFLSLEGHVNSIGMKLRLIPAGEFLMGSPESDSDAADDEKPQHRVRITQPFYLGIHPVTRGQFRRFVEATRYQAEVEKDGKGGWGWDAAAGE
jgi:hypothetical protein